MNFKKGFERSEERSLPEVFWEAFPTLKDSKGERGLLRERAFVVL